MPKLFDNRWILDLRVAGEKEHLADHLGDPGVVVGEGEEQPAAVLGMYRQDAYRPTGPAMDHGAAEVDRVVAELAVDQNVRATSGAA